jgi:hypothetical protein
MNTRMLGLAAGLFFAALSGAAPGQVFGVKSR